MQTVVSSLLLVVSTVVLSLFVVSYAVAVFEQALTNGNLQLEYLQELNLKLLNQTSNPYNPAIFNQTQWLSQRLQLP